jgi:hypothetical protein
MKRQTSLGDIISALYDTVDASGATRAASHIVTACTLELLLRQRKRVLIAALCEPPELLLH